MDCEKHNCNFTRIELEHGKTLDVCKECERERLQKFEGLFKQEQFLGVPMMERFHNTHNAEVIDTIKKCNKLGI
jgi:hypothetical protein